MTIAPVCAAQLAAGEPSVNNGLVRIPITLQDAPDEVSGLQFDFRFDAEEFSLLAVEPGPSSIDAGKGVMASDVSNEATRVVVTGFNQDSIEPGNVATILLTSTGKQPDAHPNLAIGAVVFSNPAGEWNGDPEAETPESENTENQPSENREDSEPDSPAGTREDAETDESRLAEFIEAFEAGIDSDTVSSEQLVNAQSARSLAANSGPFELGEPLDQPPPPATANGAGVAIIPNNPDSSSPSTGPRKKPSAARTVVARADGVRPQIANGEKRKPASVDRELPSRLLPGKDRFPGTATPSTGERNNRTLNLAGNRTLPHASESRVETKPPIKATAAKPTHSNAHSPASESRPFVRHFVAAAIGLMTLLALWRLRR